MLNGKVAIDRKIVDWEWFADIPVRCVFEYLIYMANFKDNRWKGIDVKRGQIITSLEHLAEANGLTIQQVRTALNKLEKTRRNNKQINKQI